jgi:hypothetical protein
MTMPTISICASGNTAATVENEAVSMKKPLSTGGQMAAWPSDEGCGYTMPPQQLIGAEHCRLLKALPERRATTRATQDGGRSTRGGKRTAIAE